MPKSTHFHTVHDAIGTDKKFRPDDEKIIEQEKQEFQASEKQKREEALPDKRSTGKVESPAED